MMMRMITYHCSFHVFWAHQNALQQKYDFLVQTQSWRLPLFLSGHCEGKEDAYSSCSSKKRRKMSKKKDATRRGEWNSSARGKLSLLQVPFCLHRSAATSWKASRFPSRPVCRIQSVQNLRRNLCKYQDDNLASKWQITAVLYIHELLAEMRL